MVDHLAARPSKGTVLLSAVHTRAFKRWLKGQSKVTQNWLKAQRFTGKDGQLATLPDRNGGLGGAVLVYDEPTPWVFATAASKLPAARYKLEGDLDPRAAADAALGWALATRRFDRYKTSNHRHPSLVWPEHGHAATPI